MTTALRVIRSHGDDRARAFLEGRLPLPVVEIEGLHAEVKAKLGQAVATLSEKREFLLSPLAATDTGRATEAQHFVQSGAGEREIERLKRQIEDIETRLAAARKARPAKIAAEKAAVAKSAEMAARIKKELPDLVSKLAELLAEADAADRELLRQSATVEGEKIALRSVWSGAALRIGRSNLPDFVLFGVDGVQIWPKERPATDYLKVPTKLRTTNVADQPFRQMTNALTGSGISIRPGETLDAEWSRNLLQSVIGNPAFEIEAL